jgi:hypothetical protein
MSGPNGSSVSCDMRGYPYGMSQPDVSASECEPIHAGEADSQLACPTHGLEKFDSMVDSGILREVFHFGDTQIFEVVQ